MNIFQRMKISLQRNHVTQKTSLRTNVVQNRTKHADTIVYDSDSFGNFANNVVSDTYLLHAWVNIAVNILIRNIARAGFTVKKHGNDVSNGVIHDLFRRPNAGQSCFDLWKETAAWWFIEGEAFWWFGPDYSGGIPKELYILDPRKMRHEGEYLNGLSFDVRQTSRRWFYQTDTELIPILSDELIHFREWNPWNPIRGVNPPLVSLSLELEQDYYANKSNSQLLKNNAIPHGTANA